MSEPRAGEGPRWLSFLKAGSSAIVSQAIAFALLPILFRLYEPEAFGRWAALQALVALIAAIAALRYDLAVVTEADDGDAAALFWGGLVLAGIIGLALGAVGYAWWAAMDPGAWSGSALPVAGLWLAAALANQLVQAWLMRQGRFGAASAAIVLTLAGANIAQLAAAAFDRSHNGLIIGSAVGALAGVALGSGFAVLRPPPALRGWRQLRSAFARHRRYPLFSLPFTILSLARERAGILILTAFAGPAQVGAYSQASRIMGLPAGLTSSALRPVVFHAAAREGVAAIAPLVQRLIAAMALLAAPWLGVLVAWPGDLFAFALGQAWREAGLYAALFAAPSLLFMLTNWLDRVLDVAERQDLNLKLEVVAALLSLGGFSLSLMKGQGLIVATSIQAAALAFSYLCVLVAVFAVCRFSIRKLLQTLGLALVLSAVAWLAARLAGDTAGPLAGLITGAGVAAVVSGGVALRHGRALLAAIAGSR